MMKEKSAEIAVKSLGRSTRRVVPFNPKALDGDNDTLVQEGTIHERVATPSVPGLSSGSEYRGQHTAPGKGSGAPLHNMSDVYPDDIYSTESTRLYGVGDEKLDARAASLIRSFRGKPNEMLTIYRAVPKSRASRIKDIERQQAFIMKYGIKPRNVESDLNVSDYYERISDELEKLKSQPDEAKIDINNGDWVSPFKEYAVDHGESALNGEYDIVSKRVRARDIYTSGDSWLEWGYEKDVTPRRGLASGGSPRIAENLFFRKEIENEDIPADQIEIAEVIDSAILEQVQIATGEISPKQAEATNTLMEIYKPDRGQPSGLSSLRKAIKKYNYDYGEQESIEEIVADIIEEDPKYEQFDLSIKSHFFVLDDSKQRVSMEQHRSRNYSYGDKSALGGFIRANKSNWLEGLSSDQISKLVVPNSIDDAFEIYLDMTYADFADMVRNNDEKMEAAKEIFKSIILSYNDPLIKREDGSPKEIKLIPPTEKQIEKTRNQLKQFLDQRPEMLEAVRKLGMPPIFPSTFDDGGDEEAAKILAGIGGSYNYNASIISIPTTSFEILDAGTKNVSQIEKRMEEGKPISAALDIVGVISPSFQKSISHEWGHYLQHMIRRAYRQKNNQYNVSELNLSKTGYQKYSKLIDGLTDIALTLTNPELINKNRTGRLVVDDNEMLAKMNENREQIMREATEYSQKVLRVFNELRKKNISGAEARAQINTILNDAKTSNVIAAPSTYGSMSSHEQFAELISFFFSGPSSRRLMSPAAIEMLKSAFSQIIPSDFDKVDKKVIAEDE